uniref:Tryptophan synthase beta chain-like PALP domain-containing protein n=1 Tax=Acrobeloides nanus TaxID=290746 RepID=A0A914CGS8_9BILA
MPEIELYFKNEAQSVTKSLKHRLAWCLYMWALIEGHIQPNRTIYEASSGNSAIAQAYFAQLLGVPYLAIVPDDTEDVKIDRIKIFGATVLKENIGKRFALAAEMAKKSNGFYMNQFAHAGIAEEYHDSGNYDFESTNVLHEIIQQLKEIYKIEEYPHFFVHAAGTGGTISSVGKFVKKYNLPTQVVLADPEFSEYYDYVTYGMFQNESAANLWEPPGLHGIGFGYCCPAIYGVTTSLKSEVIDSAYKIPDLASIASMHFLRKHGIYGGPSTGINFITSLSIAARQRKNFTQDRKLHIVTLFADGGEMYEDSYFNEAWISEHYKNPKSLHILHCWKGVLETSFSTGSDPIDLGSKICLT